MVDVSDNGDVAEIHGRLDNESRSGQQVCLTDGPHASRRRCDVISAYDDVAMTMRDGEYEPGSRFCSKRKKAQLQNSGDEMVAIFSLSRLANPDGYPDKIRLPEIEKPIVR